LPPLFRETSDLLGESRGDRLLLEEGVKGG